MKKIIILCLLSFFISSCNEDISYEERDKILEDAYFEINSNNDARIINGLRILKQYPTIPSMYKIITLWEKDISDDVENEILKTLKIFEAFVKDPSVIEKVFKDNYNINSSKQKKLKLKRLINITSVEIKYELINKIESEGT